MPTYQYACKACGQQLEAVQSFSEPSLTECPSCGGELRKVFSAVGVVFKGSGFYKTDSRSAPASDKPAAKPDAGSTPAKTDGASTPAPAAAPAAASSSSASSGTSSASKASKSSSSSTPAA
ncbi:MAG: regulatory protein FmdB family [Frankiales bacterium]|nr:regulatory protein FmdB family [Frankiales bacterium]